MAEEDKKDGRSENGKNREYVPYTYGPDILTKTKEYIDGCEDEIVDVVKQENSEKGYVMYDHKLKVKLPSIDGLALFLKVSRKSLYNWQEQYPEFADLIEQLLAKQANVLLNNGLSGDYNSTIAKMILSSKHNYIEKIETKHSGEINNPYANLSDEQLTERIRKLNNGTGTEEREDRSDIPDGGSAELSTDGKDTPTSGTVSQPSGGNAETGGSADTEKSSENNDSNNQLHNSENP